MKIFDSLPALGATAITLYLLHVATVCANSFPVNTVVAGLPLVTSVDSAVARHILTDTRSQLPPTVAADLASRLDCDSTDALPDTATLRQLTEDYSVDTATALLIECLANIPDIRKSQALFQSELEQRRRHDPEQLRYLATQADQYLILFVPGWGYRSNAQLTGADLQAPRDIVAALGFENHLVEVLENGSVEENADFLRANIRQHLRTEKKIILVSASSGGPTVALALADRDLAENPLLVGWLNICGVLRGSPVVDAFMPWPKSLVLRSIALFEGWEYSKLLSLSHRHSAARYRGFTPPPQLTVVNYIGIPFSGQLSELGRGLYERLKAGGPNDGLTFIADALAPGYTVMAVGSDHFVNTDPQIEDKTAALVPVLLKLIEG